MKKLKLIGVTFFLIAFTACNLSSEKEQAKDDSTTLKEFDEKFTINDKPISPELIKELVVGSSIAVDASKNFGDVILKDGYVKIDYGYPNGSIWYKWLGKLDNGVHVIKYMEDTGGSGTFIYLLCVKLDNVKINIDGTITDKPVLKSQAIYVLGDRTESEVRLDNVNNKVYVTIQEYMSETKKEIEIQL